MIKKRQYQHPSPRKKHPYNTPDGRPHGNSQRIGAVNCCHKNFTPEADGIQHSPQFYVSVT